MKTPIIVDEGGDVSIYQTVAAALEMEAVDVLNGEYRVYDAEGTVLHVAAHSIDSRVEIQSPSEAMKDPSRLQDILRDYIRRGGPERIGLSQQELLELNLSDLIEAIQRFQKG